MNLNIRLVAPTTFVIIYSLIYIYILKIKICGMIPNYPTKFNEVATR